MKKFTFMLVALLSVVAAFAAGPVTFNFNEMDVPTSATGVTDGDITEALTLEQGAVSLTISPKDEDATTENRFWGTKNGPQLRVYSGTLTFEVPEGATISSIVFNAAKWDEKNSANTGKLEGSTWTGEAEKVIITIAANSQINSIEVAYEGGLEAYDFDFEDGTLQGWTTIDADGDGYDWANTVTVGNFAAHNESVGAVCSGSYANGVGALTPDNFLVSPQMKLDGSITFYACAQDASYPSEVFAVAVSTKGNEDAADFKNVEEWTMTASRANAPSNTRGSFRSPNKASGSWYKYTVDLSSFKGAEGYVAIRHFNCTDWFYLVVDDITLETSKIILPDYTIIPVEGTVKSLSDFQITFNNYEVEITKDATATLKNETTDNTQTTNELAVEDNVLSFSFDETTEAGEYTLTVTGVKADEGEDVELSFNYTIEAKPDVVVLPEGLEEQAETWYFSASASESNIRNQEVAVAIDGSDIYIQGLNVDYLPEAWVKGTIDAEAGTATFESGQYFGAFEYYGDEYDMFFVGTEDGKTVADVVFDYDAEEGVLTNDQYIVISAYQDEVAYYEYYSNTTITRELPIAPDLVTLPEGVEPEVWTIEGVFSDNESNAKVTRFTEVAFDGNDIYVKGIPYYFEEAWMKGTIENGIATFPTGQFVGEDDYGWEFMLGFNADEEICDIEFAYDAEAKTLTQVTEYIVENSDSADDLNPWGYWTDMFIYKGLPVTETLETETYLFLAQQLVEAEDDDVVFARMFAADDDDDDPVYDLEDYSFQTEVGFDGNDVYFHGFSDDTAEYWIKGTLSDDGKTVTIPSGQYLGSYSFWGYVFDYYITAVGEDENGDAVLEDIVLNYNAATHTFTANDDQFIVINGLEEELYPYQIFSNVEISKMADVAAIPADPAIENYDFENSQGFNKINATIPAMDTDGNELIKKNLYYTIWFEKDGDVQQYTFTADLYGYDFEEDVTEVCYNYDGYDFWKGGETIYLEDDPEELATWTKVGIQSIYYGGGKVNTSNIVWANITTGINNVNAANSTAVYYDLQGRKVTAAQKGLLIKQTRQDNGTVKTVKVIK